MKAIPVENTDEIYMKRCLELASNGLGNTFPNPMVGSIIVHDGMIIGEGYHMKAGGYHAEANAVRSVKDKSLLEDSTLYVNLEPCSHYGKTPPCTDLIIKHKIPRVVVGCIDSFSAVSGKGIAKLKSSGCEVKCGVLEDESRELNKRFFTYHEKKRPFVILKWAESSDGFVDIIRPVGAPIQPYWITHENARLLVHKWRSVEQAIMVGTNTALKDNPKLNVRDWTGCDPLRIVIDRTLRLPESLYLFDGTIPTIVFTEKERGSKAGLEFVKIDFSENVVRKVLDELYDRQIQSLIVEGGSILLASFIDQGLWDEARVFTGDIEFKNGVCAPVLKGKIVSSERLKKSRLVVYRRD